MFQTNIEYKGDTLQQRLYAAEKSYRIHINDFIQYTVYTNKGERLIDPNFEIRKNNTTPSLYLDVQKYLVKTDSTATFPMIGTMKVAGLSLSELDSVLTKRYNDFYNDVFVISRIVNKRVFVLGTASAGTVGTGHAKVIPLENENMNLIEVLTLAGGLDNLSKAHNIRLIRGDLKNPTVMIIDLSTIEGMKQANLLVQPNDIIYIERFQRQVIQTLQESSGIISVVSTLILLSISVISISRQR
ncbi:MAG TPA: polysaccharide biosynthesis/export family protein [Cytophagales bacterium]|nr:polysaccharide biosynthesis/export family protein [Cytophagales bacterium]